MRFFLACIITVAVETAFFWLAGCRRRLDLEIVALANVVTNLTLNLLLGLAPALYPFPWILLLEAVVVAAEYLIYRHSFGGSLKLFLLTLAANVITYGIGLIIKL